MPIFGRLVSIEVGVAIEDRDWPVQDVPLFSRRTKNGQFSMRMSKRILIMKQS